MSTYESTAYLCRYQIGMNVRHRILASVKVISGFLGLNDFSGLKYVQLVEISLILNLLEKKI